MLLKSQVELLRDSLPRLQVARLSLPIGSDVQATKRMYEFKALILPARDIATTLWRAERAGKLPARLCGWCVDARDGEGKRKKVQLKCLLGMIIHVYYFRLDGESLDLWNDYGVRVIASYGDILEGVRRLVLQRRDVAHVICSLVEEEIERNANAERDFYDFSPGFGDLYHLLTTLDEWPDLRDHMWSSAFAEHAHDVDASCEIDRDTVDLNCFGADTPGWRIRWRHGDKYAEPWIGASRLIEIIREHLGDE